MSFLIPSNFSIHELHCYLNEHTRSLKLPPLEYTQAFWSGSPAQQVIAEYPVESLCTVFHPFAIHLGSELDICKIRNCFPTLHQVDRSKWTTKHSYQRQGSHRGSRRKRWSKYMWVEPLGIWFMTIIFSGGMIV